MRRTLSGCVPAALQSTVEFLSGSHCPVPFCFKFPSDCQQNRNLTGRHKNLCRHFDRSERTPPGASPYIKFDRREGDNLSRPRPPVWCSYILPTTRRVLPRHQRAHSPSQHWEGFRLLLVHHVGGCLASQQLARSLRASGYHRGEGGYTQITASEPTGSKSHISCLTGVINPSFPHSDQEVFVSLQNYIWLAKTRKRV